MKAIIIALLLASCAHRFENTLRIGDKVILKKDSASIMGIDTSNHVGTIIGFMYEDHRIEEERLSGVFPYCVVHIHWTESVGDFIMTVDIKSQESCKDLELVGTQE